ncbi:hypothetical protein WMY93_014691 [Mugilogobius chulae]|uniref:Uncharacterized protein n=1 Tax=Mugilogobius chulae TaxID=88201 RepID=A0AAW0NVM8_9GOBI
METVENLTLHQQLMDTLDDLSDYSFQRFKIYLSDRDLLREFGTVSRIKLETEDRTKILKAMMDVYGIFTVTVTKRLLKQLQMNELLKELSQWHFDPQAVVAACQVKLRTKMKTRFKVLIERISEWGDGRPFEERYTELYVTLEESGAISSEHEMKNLERETRKHYERTVLCQDIFKGCNRRGEPIRVVLTKGVAGIGKTVLTQKFSLDWAEGRNNQDIQLVFLLPFRELNVLRDTQLSMVGLIHHFFSESRGLCSFQQLRMLFIFDGLDESRLPLDFRWTQILTDPTESVSVEVLLVNLIRGSLFPSARLWITTRPAAANQIPTECVSMMTEVQGFTDPQKQQYFRKRFRDKQATAVISYIKSIRSLHAMCQIPVFCWIISTVLKNIMKTTELKELPQTLTNLYIHFLVVQIKQKNVKFDGKVEAVSAWSPENLKMVQSLGKLAFEQLQKGNLIFYASDLRECGLDAAAAACYSGVFTEVFREESGLYRDLVYCFVHLSVQEFLAALHVHLTFFNLGENLLSESTSESSESTTAFYQSAINQALDSPNGHLDLFLRFLLGLSLPTNQGLLRDLLTQPQRSSSTNSEIVQHIKNKLRDLTAEKSINMFHCLNELNERVLIDFIQRHLRDGNLSQWPTRPLHWAGVAFLLLSSDSDLDEFDLRKYQTSEKALLGLLPVLKESSKAILAACDLSQSSCAPLASVLSSCSSLTHLDLSNNDLQDSGVEVLCTGLNSAPCKLKTLKLSGCLVSEKGGASLASALSSTHSNLKKLDLSYNHPGSSVKQLTALRDDPHCPLESLRVDPAGEQWLTPGLHKYFCELSLDMNTISQRLRSSDENRTVTFASGKDQPYPDHPDRFSPSTQVLCLPELTPRCYWEVEWSGGTDVAVSYKGIQRKGGGHDCMFGENDKSWSLSVNKMHKNEYIFKHNQTETVISSNVRSRRVGVFLDSEVGVLTFFKVLSNGELSHLHTINAEFKEPLFAGLGVDWCICSSLSLVKKKTDSNKTDFYEITKF